MFDNNEVDIQMLYKGEIIMKKNIYIIVLFLVIIGAINWGLVGLFSFDLVAALFEPLSPITRGIYILVGAAGTYLVFIVKRIFDALT